MKKLLIACSLILLIYLAYISFSQAYYAIGQAHNAAPSITAADTNLPTNPQDELPVNTENTDLPANTDQPTIAYQPNQPDEAANLAEVAEPPVAELEVPDAPLPEDTPDMPPLSETQAATGIIALTFDDGPSREYTPYLLDALRERNVQVTFFVLGSRVEAFPDIVLQAYLDGHSIHIHGFDHRSFLTINYQQLQNQINRTADAIYQVTGQTPHLLRPPYGAINQEVALRTYLPNILWSIDPRDWQFRNVERIYNYVREHTEDGDVILLHDLYATTVEAAIKIVDSFLADGWRFVTVEELFAAHGVELQAGGIYRSPSNYSLP